MYWNCTGTGLKRQAAEAQRSRGCRRLHNKSRTDLEGAVFSKERQWSGAGIWLQVHWPMFRCMCFSLAKGDLMRETVGVPVSSTIPFARTSHPNGVGFQNGCQLIVTDCPVRVNPLHAVSLNKFSGVFSAFSSQLFCLYQINLVWFG